MELTDAEGLALELMAAHGLAGWGFSFDHAKRRFGSCSPQRKRITLSKTLTLLNSVEQVRETILHEIAHALTPGEKHGRRWKAKCVELGIKPKACYRDSEVVSPPRRSAPYLIGCKSCGWWVDRYKMTRRRLVCRRCRARVVIREKEPSPLVGEDGEPASRVRGERSSLRNGPSMAASMSLEAYPSPGPQAGHPLPQGERG